MSLEAIKARLGSISPRKMATYSGAARTLLEEDLPKLIKVVEEAEALLTHQAFALDGIATRVEKNLFAAIEGLK